MLSRHMLQDAQGVVLHCPYDTHVSRPPEHVHCVTGAAMLQKRSGEPQSALAAEQLPAGAGVPSATKPSTRGPPVTPLLVQRSTPPDDAVLLLVTAATDTLQAQRNAIRQVVKRSPA
jgi:hypothetical protein